MKLQKSEWKIATKLIVVNASAILVLGAILSLVFVSFNSIETLVTTIVKKDMPRLIDNGDIGNELTGIFADLLIGVFYGQEDTVRSKSDQFEQTINALAIPETNTRLKKSLDEFKPKLASVLEQSADIRKMSENFKAMEGDIIYTIETLQDVIAESIEKENKDSPAMRHLEQLKSMGTMYRDAFLKITVQIAELRGIKNQAAGKENPVIADLNYFQLSLETLLSADVRISRYGSELIDMTQKYKESVIRFLEGVTAFQKQIIEVSDAKDRFMTILKDTNKQIAYTAEDIRKRIDARTQLTRKIIIILSAGILIVSLLITYSVLNTFRAEGEAKLLAKEMELAKKIQTCLLPEAPEIKGYEIAASCAPSEEVGGDYYDVISVGGFDWIIIGDVSGHGLTSGLVMMMVQTAIHTVLVQNPQVPTYRLLSVINRTIYENIARMDEQKHMTILVIACGKEGFFDFSGLHEDMLFWCAETRKVDIIETDGSWIGLEPDISHLLPANEFRMGIGDCIVLYTDGIIEAWGKDGKMFGEDRLIKIVESSGDKSASEIHTAILNALNDYEKSDDVTLLVMKRVRE